MKNNIGKIFMAIVFAVFGVLFLTLGFFKTLFVIFLAVLGFFIGYAVDDPEIIKRILNNYFGK